MNESVEYQARVDHLLAATIREVETREALTAACEAEASAATKDQAFAHARTQAARLAVYAADSAREDAAESYVVWWRRTASRAAS